MKITIKIQHFTRRCFERKYISEPMEDINNLLKKSDTVIFNKGKIFYKHFPVIYNPQYLCRKTSPIAYGTRVKDLFYFSLRRWNTTDKRKMNGKIQI